MTAALIPAGVPALVTSADSARNGDGDHALWERLAHADQSSNAKAYAAALIAMQIITKNGLTLKAFAAESAARKIPFFGSQASVSRRLRWAMLHDEAWAAGILPRGAFISETASRPLFDGKLTGARRLALLMELFGPHLSDDAKRKLAEELSEALMREHLARHGEGPGQYKAPRNYDPNKLIPKWLAGDWTGAQLREIIRRNEDSARNAAARHG